MSQYPDQTALKVLHSTANSDDLRNQPIRCDAHKGTRRIETIEAYPAAFENEQEDQQKKRTLKNERKGEIVARVLRVSQTSSTTAQHARRSTPSAATGSSTMQWKTPKSSMRRAAPHHHSSGAGRPEVSTKPCNCPVSCQFVK